MPACPQCVLPCATITAIDIFAHALWAGAAATIARPRLPSAPRLHWCFFWGTVPDLVSFTVPALVRIGRWLTGASATLLPDGSGPRFDWVWTLYSATHSAVVFALVFAAVYFFLRRPPLAMLAWGLHVWIDVFTHRGWFAVKFLWPISAYHLDGLPWETPWFLAANWAALAVVWSLVLFSRRRAAKLAGADGFRGV